jgi:hypothetical protein
VRRVPTWQASSSTPPTPARIIPHSLRPLVRCILQGAACQSTFDDQRHCPPTMAVLLLSLAASLHPRPCPVVQAACTRNSTRPFTTRTSARRFTRRLRPSVARPGSAATDLELADHRSLTAHQTPRGRSNQPAAATATATCQCCCRSATATLCSSGA